MDREPTDMARTVARAHALVAAGVAVLSVGCASVGPSCSRPEVANPAQYRFVEGAQAQSLADAPWFQVFDDPTLQALIREALTDNLDLKVAIARVEESRARAGIAK